MIVRFFPLSQSFRISDRNHPITHMAMKRNCLFFVCLLLFDGFLLFLGVWGVVCLVGVFCLFVGWLLFFFSFVFLFVCFFFFFVSCFYISVYSLIQNALEKPIKYELGSPPPIPHLPFYRDIAGCLEESILIF